MPSSNWSWSWSLRLAWIEVGVEVTTCPDGWVVGWCLGGWVGGWWWLGGWVVDETKIIQCHLLTEVGIEVEDELGKKESLVLPWKRLSCPSIPLDYNVLSCDFISFIDHRDEQIFIKI